MKHNPWKIEALSRACQFNPEDIENVYAEYEVRPYPAETCECGGQAHYKHSIGTFKCIDCGSLQLSRKAK